MSDNESFVAPTMLLVSLERDFAASGKVSVKHCLRSKIQPCTEVRVILEGKTLDQDQLISSQNSLLNTYIPLFVPSSSRTYSSTASSNSSLWYLSRAATVIRFLKLLLELKNRSVDFENVEPSRSQKLDSALLGNYEIGKVVQQLLRSLTGCVCKAMEKTPSGSFIQPIEMEDAFASPTADCFDPVELALFCFGSMLTLNNYVSYNPYLVSPLWRGLCDIASALRALPEELLNEAIKLIIQHINDGVDESFSTYRTIQHQLESKILVSFHSQHVSFVVKILEFLSVRLGNLLTFVPDPLSNSAFQQGLEILYLVGGLGATMESLLTTIFDVIPTEVSEVFDSFQQMGNKAFKLIIVRWLNASKTEDEFFSEDILLGRIGAVMKCVRKTTSKTAPGALSYSIGRCLIMTDVLEIIEQRQCLDPMCKHAIELLLQTSYELLFQAFPLCFERISANCVAVRELLVRIVRVVPLTLLDCEIQSLCMSRTPTHERDFHLGLLRWFIPPHQDVAMHPLTRELVITVLYMYTIGSHMGANHSLALQWLKLVLKVFFDFRTRTELRENTAALLIRLLNSPIIALKSWLESAIAEEVAALWQRISIVEGIDEGVLQLSLHLSISDINCIAQLCSKLPSKPSLSFDCSILTLDDAIQRRKLSCALAINISTTTNALTLNEDVMNAYITTTSRLDREDRHESVFCLLGVAIMQHAGRVCTNALSSLSAASMEVISRIIHSCLEARAFEESKYNNEYSCQLTYSCISFLSLIGRLVSKYASNSDILVLGHSLKNLFLCNSWATRSWSVSAFVVLASSIPTVHNNALAEFVPLEVRKILHCRLQGRLSCDLVMLRRLRVSLHESLRATISLHHEQELFFPSSASVTIARGSYLVTMPTQQGRDAIVFFAPGPQSLNDIKFLLDSSCEGERPGIQRVQRTSALRDGSCRVTVRDAEINEK